MGNWRHSEVGLRATRSPGIALGLASIILLSGSIPAVMAEERDIPASPTPVGLVAGGSAAGTVSLVSRDDIAAFQGQIDATRAAMQEMQEAQQQLAEQLIRAHRKVENLEAARSATEARLAETENALRATEEILARTEKQRDASQREVSKLEADIASLSGENDRLVSTLADVKSSLSDREQRVDSLQQLLPAGEGGTITRDQAREETSRALQRLAEPGSSDEAVLQDARTLVRRNQFLIGYAEGARGIYLTKPGDSLSLISTYFYGEGRHWKAIQQANEHLLTRPDRLESGMTLIIP